MDLWDEMSTAASTNTIYIKEERADLAAEEINIEYQIPDCVDEQGNPEEDIDIKYHHLEDSWKDTTIQDLLTSYEDCRLSNVEQSAVIAGPNNGEILFRRQAHKDCSNLMRTLQRLALRVEPKDRIYGEVVSASSILPPDKTDCHFKCGKCNRLYRYKHTLKQHSKECGTPPHIKCPECDRRFKQMQNMKTHFAGHHPDKTWVGPPRRKVGGSAGAHRCDKCGRRYSTAQQLHQHVQRYCGNTKEVLRCAHCSFTSKRLCHLRRHLNTMHGSSVLCRHMPRVRAVPYEGPRFKHQCPDCDKSYPCARSLSKHRRLQCRQAACQVCHLEEVIRTSQATPTSTPQSVDCVEMTIKLEPVDSESDEASYAVSQRNTLRNASRTGSKRGGRPRGTRFTCPKCLRLFCNEDRLANHACGDGYKCEHCPAVKKTRDSITSHLRELHPEVCGVAEWSACDRCDKTYSTRHKLARHQAHCKAQKLRCPQPSCSYRTPFKYVLRKHMAVGKHTDRQGRQSTASKPWSCQICGRSYRDKYSFKKHVLYKCGQNPRYPCHKCGRSYRNKNGLSRHLEYECGKEARLQCPHCPYRAKRNFSLTSHLFNKHKAVA